MGQRTPLREWKATQNGGKYLWIVYLIMDLYKELLKHNTKTNFLNEQKI